MKFRNPFKRFQPVFHVCVLREIGDLVAGDCEAHADDLVTAVAYADAIGRQWVDSGTKELVTKVMDTLGGPAPRLRILVWEQTTEDKSQAVIISEEVY